MAAPDLIESLLPGSRLDRYELLCPLARGGMAAVWIARQTGKHGFEKLVALKTILPQYSRDTRFRRMFLDEAHIAAGIDHPNVAHILDLGEQHDLLYIVMEYVDGDALSRLQRNLGKRGLSVPPAIALRILADACAGLHAAHELRSREGQLLGVVHRDVSPQNVLVGVKGPSKVIDFGVAKARDRFEEQHTLHGKIQYMAPEQAMGKEIDRRADVWAIGAMLYALLAGAPPYEGENQIHSLQLLTSGKPPPPLPEWVPRPIVDVVRAVLVHEPHRRIPDAQMLQMAIEDAMVQSGLRATHSDVAQLMAEHLSDRADKRRSSIELALQAAAERERVAKLLPMPAPEGMTDMVNLNPRMIGGPGAQGGPAMTDAALGANTSSTLVPPLSFEPESRSKAWIVGLAFAATVTSVGVASVLATRPSKPSSVVSSEESTPAAPVIPAGKVTPPPIPTELDLSEPAPSAKPTATASAPPAPAPKATSVTSKVGAPAPTPTSAPAPTSAPKPTAAPTSAGAAKPPVKPKAPDDGF